MNVTHAIKYALAGVLLLISTPDVSAHGEEGFTWTTLNVNSQYDLKNSHFYPSVDLNTSFLLVNAGVSFKSMPHLNKKNASFLVGLGIGNMLQAQAGFSPDGVSLKFRSDLIVGNIFPKFAEKHPYLSLTTISLNAERFYKNDLKWVVGVGVGFSLNTLSGFHFFKR